MRIVFTGGGTGGHFFPILAVAREIKRIAEEERILDLQLFYFGPEAAPPEVMREEEIVFSHISAGKIRTYASLKNASDIFIMAIGILEALIKMFLVMPDVVFAKGGYGSFPALFVARLYRIPVIIHESDSVAGRVNRWAGRFAKRIAISFPAAASSFPKERTALTGIPVRKRVLGGTVEQARESLGIFSPRPVIFITGGSQGASIINQTVIRILKPLIERFEIIHQAGEREFEDVRLDTLPLVKGSGAEQYYHLFPFLNEGRMRDAFLLADLVVARAGASTIFEIAAIGKPAIVIPLKIAAQDHQRKNAFDYASHGAAIVLEEDNLTPSVLWNEIEKLMADPERRARMSEAAKTFARLDAAELIAREILKLGIHYSA